MPLTVDYLVVGAGLTGATIARQIADAGRDVLVVDRRSHVGGNVHDSVHSSGIVVHSYGPHYFRTNSEALWRYVNTFGDFFRFEARVQSRAHHELVEWPIRESYLRHCVGSGWSPAFSGVPGNFEEAALALMPRVVYETFIEQYTRKQWGVPATRLSARLADRLAIRTDDEPRLMRHKYQGIPVEGYARWMDRMLAGIPVRLGLDYLHNREVVRARRLVVFTGPIDEYFGFDLGRLAYRGQVREASYLADTAAVQPCGQINTPLHEHGPAIRTLEWRHMMPPHRAAGVRGTVLTTEYPFTPGDPDQYEYPFPDATNRRLYEEYARRARAMPGLLVCGRLGEYRYYDMDQAIARALMLARQILGSPAVGDPSHLRFAAAPAATSTADV